MAPVKSKRRGKPIYSVTLAGGWFGSDWLYAWIFRLIYMARNVRDVKQINMRLPFDLTARQNGKLMDDAWAAELRERPQNPTVLGALKRVYMTHYFLIGIWKVIWGIFTWLGAWYFLKVFINFLQNNEASSVGTKFAVALLVSSLASSIAIHQLYGQCAKEGVRVKAGLTSLIFRKALVLARIKGGAGEVINLVSSDVSRVQDAVLNFHFLWSALIEVVAILVIAFIEVGNAAFTSLALIICLAPVQVYLGRRSSMLLIENTIATTERVHLMSELLTAIKLIKFYAWEKPFSQRVSEIRQREANIIYRSIVLKAINYTFVFAAPVVIAIVALAVYQFVTSDVKLTSSVAFTVLSVFNTLRYPLLMMPQAVKSTAGASISLKRITEYLLQTENTPLPFNEPQPSNPVSIELKNASFAWEGDQHSCLQDFTFTINRGEVLAVIGDVGSGKSSLVAALLGQMKMTGGEMTLYGTTSYVPQEAWMLNFTLRENILFGSPMDEARYKEVIRVCALQRDLTLLVAGDQTEIAERGANLSGGQKQRASLARAVYHNGDIILLDDPLSAVDQAVGRHIFEQCIKGHLKGKTIVMVTHQLQYLEQCDKVLAIKDGKISKYGSHAELMANDAEYADLIMNHVSGGEEGEDDATDMPVLNEKEFNIQVPESEIEENIEKNQATIDKVIELKNLNLTEKNQLSVKSLKNIEINDRTISSIVERNQLSVIRGADHSHDISKIIQRNELTIHSFKDVPDSVDDDDDSVEDEDEKQRAAGQLIAEDKSTESLGWPDFVQYGKAGSGTSVTVGIIILFFVVHGIRIGSDYWLRLWIPDTLNIKSDATYVVVYGCFVAMFTTGVLIRGLAFAKGSSKKSAQLHNKMYQSVMRAPMAFFDTTPLGRILSAFSKHQFHVDESMPDAAMQGLQYAPLTAGAFLLVAIIVPWNWSPVICSLIFAAIVVSYSSPAETKFKAAEAVTKPPIFAHLTASLEGLFSIRAYSAQRRFDDINLEKLDINHEALVAMSLTKSWTALYLDIITSFVIFFTAWFLVLFRGDIASTTKAQAATGGLALSNALQILVFLQWTIRMLGDVQAQISSVGQLHYYATQVNSEAPAEIPDKKPPPSWPHEGRIVFKDIVLKYHEFGVAVLKNVTFTIQPEEKVGVVGRTGSGKSTIVNALLRIVESCGGTIHVDGIDIATIGLDDLRTKLAIIPQEPVLFVGTVRTNLDPFHKSTDAQIWKALDSVHLGDKIRAMPQALDSAVIENGKNFSLGQRQLFCIARAILSNTKVLILDEATAAIDMQTDALIQNAIKENFADKSTITIAHRLNTIIESDKVLVMDGGVVVEFDEPLKLLDIPNGHFASLVANTGEASAKKLRIIAEEAAAARAAKRKGLPPVEQAPNPKTSALQTYQQDSELSRANSETKLIS